MSNVVQPRWKRRADEIADAIGDELSVTVLAPVDIGNDVRIHSDSITALSNSISSSLPTAAEIAAAIWSQSNRSVTTDALKASDLNLDVTRKLRVVSEGHIGVDITHVDGNTIASGAAVPIITAGNDTVAITGSVSTNIGNVTVPVSNPNNITVPVTNPNNLTVPVSVGTAAVPIKATLGGIPQNSAGNNVLVPVNPTHSVTVPVSVGNVTVPLTNPNNVTVPVANTANVTVPVSVGGASVPAHVPANLSVPTSVSNSLSVPVSVGSAAVPVSVGSATVPVANTNNVVCDVANTNNITIPVSADGTLDVKVVGNETYGIIMTKNYFEANIAPYGPPGDYSSYGFGLGAYSQNTYQQDNLSYEMSAGWTIRVNGVDIHNQDITNGLRGTTPAPFHVMAGSPLEKLAEQASVYPFFIQCDNQATVDNYHGRKVTLSSVANVWIVEPFEVEKRYPPHKKGYITGDTTAYNSGYWTITLDSGDTVNSRVWNDGNWVTSHATALGALVVQHHSGTDFYISMIDAT